jgi:hypothetical protein
MALHKVGTSPHAGSNHDVRPVKHQEKLQLLRPNRMRILHKHAMSPPVFWKLEMCSPSFHGRKSSSRIDTRILPGVSGTKMMRTGIKIVVIDMVNQAIVKSIYMYCMYSISETSRVCIKNKQALSPLCRLLWNKESMVATMLLSGFMPFRSPFEYSDEVLL